MTTVKVTMPVYALEDAMLEMRSDRKVAWSVFHCNWNLNLNVYRNKFSIFFIQREADAGRTAAKLP